MYTITLNKIANNIIGFTIKSGDYSRVYPIYLKKETTIVEDWIKNKTEEFLHEIKNY